MADSMASFIRVIFWNSVKAPDCEQLSGAPCGGNGPGLKFGSDGEGITDEYVELDLDDAGVLERAGSMVGREAEAGTVALDTTCDCNRGL
jgi:hypothetical protein